ncbi:winged helix-turn-helix domain-containing protein [Micromonospora chokoriensis]
MPSYDSTKPKGRADLTVPSAEVSLFDPSCGAVDAIGDLLKQVSGDVERESTPERQRAESRLADHRLIEQVRYEMMQERPQRARRDGRGGDVIRWRGFAYHQLFDDLWLYALPVVRAFLKRNHMGRLLQRYVPDRGFTMRSEDMVVLAHSYDERTELAVDIVAKAVEDFRKKAVTPGKSGWKPSMEGASLRTYFIGTCALVYPRVYEKWSKTRRGKLDLVASYHEINFDEIGGIISRDLADPAAVAGIRADLKQLIDVAAPTTKLILGLLAQDMTQVQIASELGLSVKAVNRRLAHFRQRVANPTRPEHGRKPISRKKPIHSGRIQASNPLHSSNRKVVA